MHIQKNTLSLHVYYHRLILIKIGMYWEIQSELPQYKIPWTPVWHCYMQQDRDNAELQERFSTFIERAPKSTTFQICCISRCNILLWFTKVITASSAHNWRVNISVSFNSQLTNLSFAAKCTWYSIYLTRGSKMVHGNRRHCCTYF